MNYIYKLHSDKMKFNPLIIAMFGIGSIALSSRSQDISYTGTLIDSIPQNWQLSQEYFQTTPTDDKWWQSFDDPTLISLIKQAVDNNFNVVAAQKRILSAAQMSRATKAGYYPSLGISAGYSRERMAGAAMGSKSPSSTESYFSLGLTMNWEIDVFGRIQSQLKSDKANYEATIAEYDATLVSLVSNLAKAYFQLRLAQEQYAIAESNIANNEELLHIAQTRYDVGLSPAVDVVQAEMVVVQTKATLPGLKADISTYLNEIATLVGVYPDRLNNLLTVQPLPEAPQPGMVSSPESLLRRRPDIVEAEKELAVYAAKIGIAKKDFLPTLSVSASVGTESHSLKDIFGKNSLYYNVMPTLSWTIFDGMARNAQLAEARYDFEAQIESYNMTVMTAIEEVNNAMISWQSITDELIYDQMLLKQAKRVLELQTDRYRQGLNDFSDVASAETSVLTYENTLASAKASQLAALVTLYTALGGGF